MCAKNDDFRYKRYARQVSLPEIGAKGQEKLKRGKVLVVGCGGLGSAVIPLIAASGLGKLVLCDDDTVRISNLNRQIIYREQDIGQSKVSVAKEFIKARNSDTEVLGINAAIGPQNFEKILEGIDVVVDCVDRLSVKIFLNDACVLMKKMLIHCVAIGFMGEVMVIPPGGKPCYRCFFEGKQVSTGLNCANSGVIAATVGIIGSLASSEIIKYIVGISLTSVEKLYRIDLLKNSFTSYKFQANEQCPCCSSLNETDPYDLASYEGKLRSSSASARHSTT